MVQRQKASIVAPGSCEGVAWANDGSPANSTSPWSDSLLSGYCYRWALTLTDKVGNTNLAPLYSGAVRGHERPQGMWGGWPLGYFAAETAGTIPMVFISADAESGIESITLSPLSSEVGWTTFEPGTYPGEYLRVELGHVAAASATSFTVTIRNKAGREFTYFIDMQPDFTPPTADFLTPNEGSTTVVASTSYAVTWTLADADSGIASNRVFAWRLEAPVVSPGVCGPLTDVPAYSETESPFVVTGLTPGRCYQWRIHFADRAAHWVDRLSGVILIDTSAPAAPSIDLSGAQGVSRTGNTIFFRPDAAGTMTLAAASLDPESSIDHYAFGALSAPEGWTYTPGQGSSKTLTWSAGAGPATLEVTATNAGGMTSEPIVLSLVPDDGAPTATFTSPAAGQTGIQTAPGYGVSWTEDDAGSGVATRSVQRQKASVVTAGTCAGVSWSNDGSPSSDSRAALGHGPADRQLLPLDRDPDRWCR